MNPFLAKLAALKAATPTPEPTIQKPTLSFAEKLAVAAKLAAKVDQVPAPVVPTPEAPAPVAETVAEKKELSFLEKLALAKGSPAPKLAPKPAPVVVEAQAQAQTPVTEELVYREADGTIVFNTSDTKIRLNEKQMQAVRLAAEGKSFCLTGAAGTGKTTAQAGVVWSLHESGSFGVHDFKYIGNQPSIALVAFTKVAVRNMQKALRKNPLIEGYANHCMTIHSLLEYEPESYEEYNDEGEVVTKWGFKPQRTAFNPLTLTHLIIEEASMVDLTLWQALFDALPSGVQIIFLGDINQLRPVFGDSILIYALGKLPIIELTEVYRQALESPIISNAHRILNGETIKGDSKGLFNVAVGRHQTKVGQETMAAAMIANFKALAEAGRYDPNKDMILSPWNKQAMGTKNINEQIATWLGYERNAEVVQVKASRNTWWLAVGDRVLVDKRLGTITKIEPNPRYTGGTTLSGSYSRSGVPLTAGTVDKLSTEVGEEDWASLVEDYSGFTLADLEDVDVVRASSHKVYVVYEDDELQTEHCLENGGEFGEDKFQFGYCLTVHKAQGSEWDRVFMLLHWDHASTATRELLYTAVTRAAEEFTIFTKMPVVEGAISRASFKGKTLADKIAYFQAGATFKDEVPLLSKLNDPS